ncbi:MAG: hypothetical protein ACYS6I_01315 [Planctomycetota bacterium]
MFRFFFSEQASQATKGLAKGSFILGLLLIGFGMLVFILRDLFALLAAAVFFIGGFSAIGYAIRLFIAAYRMRKGTSGPDGAYRENVNIRIEEHHDM